MWVLLDAAQKESKLQASNRLQKVIFFKCVTFMANVHIGETHHLTVVNKNKRFKVHVFVNRFPALDNTPLFTGNKSYCWSLDPVGLLFRGDDNCLLFQIFLYRWDPKEDQEENKKNDLKNGICPESCS